MISDFGLSKTEEDDSMMATACGTPGYVGRFMEIKTAEFYVLGIASIDVCGHKFLLGIHTQIFYFFSKETCICKPFCFRRAWLVIFNKCNKFVPSICQGHFICISSKLVTGVIPEVMMCTSHKPFILSVFMFSFQWKISVKKICDLVFQVSLLTVLWLTLIWYVR